MTDLDETITRARRDLDATPEDHPDCLKRLNNLAVWLGHRFSRMGAFSDLEEAIQLSRQAVDITTEENSKRARLLANHAGHLGVRFRTTNIVHNLDETIKHFRQAIAITPEDGPDRSAFLGQLGVWLSERYSVIGALPDLEEAIQVERQAIDTIANDNPHRAALLNNLAQALADKLLATKNTVDLEEAITISEQAINTTNDDPVRAASLHTLAHCLSIKFSTTKAMNDLQKAIQVQQQAVDLTPEDDEERPRRLNSLGTLFGNKYLETGTATDLKEAIRLSQEAVDTTPTGNPDYVKRLNDVVFWLNERESPARTTCDPKEAIVVSGQVVDATAGAGMKLFKVDTEIASCLQDLDDEGLRSFLELSEENTENEPDELFIYTSFLIFLRSQMVEYLDRAIHRAQSWISSTPTENEDRARRFEILNMVIAKRIPLCGTGPGCSKGDTLFTWLNSVFEGFTSESDVETAFSFILEALNNVPDYYTDNTTLANGLNSKANYINESFETTSDINALNIAINFHKLSLDTAPRGTSGWAGLSYNLALRLRSRAKITGSLVDIDLAIQSANQAVDVTLETDHNHGMFMQALGGAFRQRFELTGAIDDLDRAVKHCTAAVKSCAPDHVGWFSCLSALANALGRRFEMTGSLEDINKAVETANVQVKPGTGWQYDVALMNLGCWLMQRSERTGSEEDLNQAIEVTTRAIDASPENGHIRHTPLANLGRCYFIRFERSRSLQALDQAIEATTQAINASPKDHQERAHWLSNLGSMLNRRFEEMGSKDDLDRSIETTKLAVEATPRTNARRCALLLNLGEFLRIRFEEYGSENDRTLCLTSYMDGWNCRDGPPSERILLAKRASEILISQTDWQESHSLLKAAVQLLPLVSPRALQHTDKQHRLGTYAGLTSDAAAVSLNAGIAPVDALQLLEAGRGIISSSVMDMRGDVSELEQQHPGLAARFIALREVLDPPREGRYNQSAMTGHGFAASQTSLRRGAERDLGHLLEEIRAKPGYHNFLLPSSREELLSAADPDPIVIVNLSSIRSDAFIIYKSRTNLVPLGDLRVVDVQNWSSKLYSAASLQTDKMLKWLWDTICGPILEALDFKSPPSSDDWPHLWWIPTGLLSRLPLHAAGYHKLEPARSVLDVVISSYASSVKALLHRRKRASQPSPQPRQDSLLAVTMHHTPDLSTNQVLPFVKAEWEMLIQT